MDHVAWAFRAPSEGYRWMMSKSDPRTARWALCGSPLPMLSLIGGYVYFVKVLGPRWMKGREPLRIERLVAAYNAAMVALSAFFFAYGGSFTYIPPWGKYSWFCEPIDYGNDPRVLQMVNLGWWYLMLKIAEFADTVFFVLRKKMDHISALHVIHHSLVAWGVWIGIKFGAGGSNAFFPFLNCFVHTLMYSYYCLAALGMKRHLWWKKHLTVLQMVQFVVAFAHGLVPLFHDCGYQRGFAYAIMFHALLFMAMFADFYRRTYHREEKQPKTQQETHRADPATTDDAKPDSREPVRRRPAASGTRQG